jgi:hypothetical protein
MFVCIELVYHRNMNKTATVRQKNNLILSPKWVLDTKTDWPTDRRSYSKCHVTSNKANSNLECAEDKFQKKDVRSERRPVGGQIRVVSMKHEWSVKVEERVLRNSSHHKRCAGFD